MSEHDQIQLLVVGLFFIATVSMIIVGVTEYATPSWSIIRHRTEPNADTSIHIAGLLLDGKLSNTLSMARQYKITPNTWNLMHVHPRIISDSDMYELLTYMLADIPIDGTENNTTIYNNKIRFLATSGYYDACRLCKKRGVDMLKVYQHYQTIKERGEATDSFLYSLLTEEEKTMFWLMKI